MPSDTDALQGWLVVGHGTRSTRGQREFTETVRQLALRANVPVEGSFLELVEPSIAEGVRRLQLRGVQEVMVAPLLLFTAGHAREDIPESIQLAFSGSTMRILGQSAALEHHEALLELSELRVREALPFHLSPDTTVLLVGRGSSDSQAIAMVQQYADRLSQRLRLEVRTAFVARAQPELREALQQLAIENCQRVIVLPHLLFAGEVLDTIANSLRECVTANNLLDWRIAERLGSHPLVIEALLARIRQCLKQP